MNNNFIGSTHIDTFKSTSNLILSTSNILEQHIAYSNIATSNILEQHISYSNTNCSNFILATSNILETHSSNFTNALRYDVNKWINEEIELTSIINTYIYNKNYLGEIKFLTFKLKINYITELDSTLFFFNYI